MRKTMTRNLTLMLALGVCLAPLGWSQQVVTPEAPEAAQVPHADLTAAEREFLLSLTRVAARPAVTEGGEGEGPVARNEGAPDLSNDSLIELVERVDQLLARASKSGNAGDNELLLSLLSSPLPEIRVTALNWVVGSDSLAADALVQAVQDRDDVVRDSAFTYLVAFGMDAKAVSEMKTRIKEPEAVAGIKSDIRVAVRRGQEAARQRAAAKQ